MREKTKRRQMSAASFLALTIVFLSFALMYGLLSLIGVSDIQDAKKTYADYSYQEYTFLLCEIAHESEDSDPSYYIQTEESNEKLFISNLLYSREMSQQLTHLNKGVHLAVYTDDVSVVELYADGNCLFSLDDYNTRLYQNGLETTAVLASIAGLSLIGSIVCFCLRTKAKEREKLLRQRYHIRKIPCDKGDIPQDDNVISKKHFIVLLTSAIALFAMFPIILVIGLLLNIQGPAQLFCVIAAFIPAVLSLVILIGNYRTLAHYEKRAFVRKLYATDISFASLAISRDTILKALEQNGYEKTQENPYYKKQLKNASRSSVITHAYATLCPTSTLFTLAEALKEEPPIKKNGIMIHHIYFVFVENDLEDAIQAAYASVARAYSEGGYSHVPILITENGVYFIKVGTHLIPYRHGLDEGLFLLKLI